MATEIENRIDREMNHFADRYEGERRDKESRLSAHDEKVRDMPWYERAATYFERRRERRELVKDVELAWYRGEVAHEVKDTVRGVLREYNDQLQRTAHTTQQIEREPVRELSRSATRSRSDNQELER
jgi:hypothetical protein